MNSKKGRGVVNWKSKKVVRLLTKGYTGGKSTRAIAAELGVSHTTVNTHLDRLGVPRRGKRTDIRVRDLVGRRYGKLVVLHRDGMRYPTRWVVRCDCGNETSVEANKLYRRKSCGCMRGRRRGKVDE